MEKLSVVIPVKNEEKNIRECLETVEWVDEIIIIDDYSADKTVEICKEYTNKIFERKMTGFSEQRDFGDQQATGDWIISLDADQRINSALREEIKKVLKNGTDCNGFTMYKITSFLGRWMRYCGWRSEVLVMFRKGKARYDGKRVHEKMIVEGKIGHLKGEILHKAYHDLSEYFTRLDLYTSYGAQDLWDKGVRLRSMNYPIYFILKPVYIFFRKYIKQQGFREGIRGFFISVITAFIVFMHYAKLWEKQKNESPRQEDNSSITSQ